MLEALPMQRELNWEVNGKPISRLWLTESELSPPKRILLADDRLKADEYYRQASEGTGFLWTGDFQNAKQLMQAVQRRIEKQAKTKKPAVGSLADFFHRHRQSQAHRAQLLSKLLIPVGRNLKIELPRAPDAALAIKEATDVTPEEFVLSLKDLLAYIGAHEWRKKGVEVPALQARIHPHFGTFSPVRGEYLELIANAPLPKEVGLAFDVGTGTGVIAAILAKRGVPKIIATDMDHRAFICASENISRLSLNEKVQVAKADLCPDGKADLIVCNPPWVPAKPTSPIERAIYDEDSKMLKGFLAGVAPHLEERGQAWLILSDLAEHLGLRSPDEVLSLIEKAKLKIIEIHETKPKHGKARDQDDPLFEARSKEVTKLYRMEKA